MSLNKVMLIGNVGKEPDIRVANGDKVASFIIATSERWKDRNGDIKEVTDWHNIVSWKKGAEYVEKYITKGCLVYVEGKLRTRSYETNGEKRYITEIITDSVQLMRKKETEQEEDVPF